MTPSPDESSPSNPSDRKCVICKKPLPDDDAGRLYCKNRRCYHEYEKKVGKAHSTREYREYIWWSEWYMYHLEYEWEDDLGIHS